MTSIAGAMPHELISPSAVESAESARDLVLRLADTMDKLLEVVETETEIVRTGKVSQLAELEAGKVVLARRYIRDIECLKANASFIGRAIPELVEEFRQGYIQFRAALEANMTVLATAPSVSEGIARGATEMATQERAQTY
ncbi:hypothetical protein [Blastochloris viridis]|uniref:Uncharacterized protein n=1 Tax=Blastochloris viridis TaxID=1079 RepID=A0A0H5B6Z4_BLAVI|nr:hypothetical protein [Blastochloris viridis]ALK08781.1 hypothetical protein BVIR_990 [Blastochloris viridis]BAR97922.1 hypothetical protein BV133_329 [Blastochloris viridis]CUU41442.1 hypothetical protein BVIRIDIS_04330 [Blastochloris viridis]